MEEFGKGDRVITPGGPGEVVYKRMKPPTYGEVDVYSVCLDARKAECQAQGITTYTGTIYKAEMVKPEK